MDKGLFIERLLQAEKAKTLYIKGCFGAPMTPANKKRYETNNEYNKRRASMIENASSDTFGFDCVCLIKGILWGWTGDLNKVYGGAEYQSNGVPDFGTETMLKYCTFSSSDFRNIEAGEVLYLKGHAGVYIGDGLAIECTPKWGNDVQITAVANIGTKAGYNARAWEQHGKLMFVDYGNKVDIRLNVLTRGDTGEEVKTLQRLLNTKIGFALTRPLVVDGSFGSLTLQAVTKYQTIYELSIDGSVGKQTWSSLLGV